MKKIVNYGSPKRFQEKRRNPNSNPGIKKWPCKRLKGEHAYGKWIEKKFYPSSVHSGFWEKFCIGCNHKEYWIAPNLPGPYYQIDKTKRPPGFEE